MFTHVYKINVQLKNVEMTSLNGNRYVKVKHAIAKPRKINELIREILAINHLFVELFANF